MKEKFLKTLIRDIEDKHPNFKKLVNIIKYFSRRYSIKKTLEKQRPQEFFKAKANKRMESWTILHYERICSPHDTPIAIAESSYVTKDTFRMHCLELKKNCSIISLNNLISILESGNSPSPETVVLTFDGGHLDSYNAGLQILIENDISATFSVPTSYIGTNHLLLEDMVATAFRLMFHNGITLGHFKSLSVPMNEALTKATKGKPPSAKSFSTFLTLLHSLEPKERTVTLHELKLKIRDLPKGLPKWTDFMSWDDAIQLSKLGHGVISKLHTNPILTELSPDQIESELEESQKLFYLYEIPWSPIISIPYGLYYPETLEILNSFEISHCLTNTLAPIYFDQKSKTKLLSRLSVCEGNSSTRELFLARLFGIK